MSSKKPKKVQCCRFAIPENRNIPKNWHTCKTSLFLVCFEKMVENLISIRLHLSMKWTKEANDDQIFLDEQGGWAKFT